MGFRGDVVLCVFFIVVGFVALILGWNAIVRTDNRAKQLIEEFSRPGITSKVEIDKLTITTPDGETVILEGLDADVNSRILDLLTNAAAYQ